MGIPQISVLMPVYNGSAYLADAVESILNQTFSDFEFLIIDDGSTDGTREILKEYQKSDSRILVHSQPHLGLVSALNKGIETATGIFIARMDADDISEPTRLAEQVAFLTQHPDVGVLGAKMKIIDKNKTLQGNYDVPVFHGLIAWNLLFGRSFAHPTVMIRKDLIRSAGGYKDHLPFVEDTELWLRLIEKTRFANLDRLLVTYRTHPEATSVKQSKLQQANVRIARQKFISELLDKPISIENVECLMDSQKTSHTLTMEQKQQAVSLLFQLYEAFRKKEIILSDDLDLVYDDYLKRTIWASQPNKNDSVSNFGHLFSFRYLASMIRSPLKGRMKKILHFVSARKDDEIVSRGDTDLPSLELFPKAQEPDGITIIILSYNRQKGLHSLLKSILLQELQGLTVEIMVINNYEKANLRKLRNSRLGRALQEKLDIKIFDSSYNWWDSARYAFAILAKHETILHIDDDITLLDPNFILYMYKEFKKLRKVDILSCWNMLWTQYTEDNLCSVGLNFSQTELTEVTESDVCGTGICMYNKEILFNKQVFNVATARNFPNAYDMAFSISASMELGSRGYFLPSFGMLKFHEDQKVNAIHEMPGHYDARLSLFKSLYKAGYVPVMSRSSSQTGDHNTPEWRAIQKLKPKCRPW